MTFTTLFKAKISVQLGFIFNVISFPFEAVRSLWILYYQFQRWKKAKLKDENKKMVATMRIREE